MKVRYDGVWYGSVSMVLLAKGEYEVSGYFHLLSISYARILLEDAARIDSFGFRLHIMHVLK